uniref:ORF66 n=1 Tax=Human herpesvirus 8 TaxID=37296 RepID=A0A0N9RLK5_HHV8|nr:ORF66 [Human gammaherpesvirus 8]QLF97238.1 ORF66 [Human gammaherpesvirus 8]UQT63536.1 ORF66 [Human gammaherpesvirus 8]WPM02570.1 ORF66 [Human gammaherpesvirus 8]WPM03344.1 ORF66 [Human gammaherpesvirus 8]
MALDQRWDRFLVSWFGLDEAQLTAHRVFEGENGVPVEEYVAFVIFGERGFQGNMPSWARHLLDRPSLAQAIAVLRAGSDTVAKQAQICAAQQLLGAHVWVVVTLSRAQAADHARAIPRHVWAKYLSLPFSKACAQLCKLLALCSRFPLVTCCSKPPPSLPWLRKKWHGPLPRRPLLEVPSPTRRGVAATGDCNGLGIGAADTGLREALERVAPTVPCGNPFDAMLGSLCFLSLIKSRHVVLPACEQEGPGLVRNLGRRLLAYNVLSPCVSIPVICSRVARAALAKRARCARAVVCMECGHCLNFGRGKFHTVNFPPTNVFFSRDRKEKQFTICATTGRIYCSYCGSEHMRVYPLCDVTGRGTLARVVIRAVLANNAALAIRDLNQTVSFVVPCLGTPDCEAALLKHRDVRGLLQLTSQLLEFCCGKCSS